MQEIRWVWSSKIGNNPGIAIDVGPIPDLLLPYQRRPFSPFLPLYHILLETSVGCTPVPFYSARKKPRCFSSGLVYAASREQRLEIAGPGRRDADAPWKISKLLPFYGPGRNRLIIARAFAEKQRGCRGLRAELRLSNGCFPDLGLRLRDTSSSLLL